MQQVIVHYSIQTSEQILAGNSFIPLFRSKRDDSFVPFISNLHFRINIAEATKYQANSFHILIPVNINVILRIVHVNCSASLEL